MRRLENQQIDILRIVFQEVAICWIVFHSFDLLGIAPKPWPFPSPVSVENQPQMPREHGEIILNILQAGRLRGSNLLFLHSILLCSPQAYLFLKIKPAEGQCSFSWLSVLNES